MAMEFKISGANKASPVGGFVTDVDGYLCFIAPAIEGSNVVWKWSIQSGGGWTHRGGRNVKTHTEGISWTAESAEKDILDALSKLPE